MRFSEMYCDRTFGLSFELFPPKTEAGFEALYRHTAELVQFDPHVITCTYGAGGTTREKTLDVVAEVRSRFGCSVAAHLTCVGSTVEMLREYLRNAENRGVDNIVALRGDPPAGTARFSAQPGGLTYANELVELLRREFPGFGVAVAGYPETHREAPSPDSDLHNLKRKVAAGADVVITQLFFDNEDFFRFRDRCESMAISVPIVPGLLPITNLKQIQRITSLCGARMPSELLDALEQQGENQQKQFEVGVEFAIRQTQQLVDQQVPGIHFYVLNKSEAASRVLRAVGLPA